MFHKNGIVINEDILKELFLIVDEDCSGQLSMQEFKRFSMLEDAAFSNSILLLGLT